MYARTLRPDRYDYSLEELNTQRPLRGDFSMLEFFYTALVIPLCVFIGMVVMILLDDWWRGRKHRRALKQRNDEPPFSI
jgi:hypothetical protein